MPIIKDLLDSFKKESSFLKEEPKPSLTEKSIDWIKRFKSFEAYEEYVVNKWKKKSGLPEKLKDSLGGKPYKWELKKEYKSDLTEAGLLMLAALVFGIANQAVDLNIVLQIATGATGLAGIITGVTSTVDFILMNEKHAK